MCLVLQFKSFIFLFELSRAAPQTSRATMDPINCTSAASTRENTATATRLIQTPTLHGPRTEPVGHRFPSYRHLMSFWWLIKPSVHTIIRVSRSKAAAKKNEEIVHARTSVRQQLQPIDEFFLFLIYLSVCGFEGERPGTPFPCTPLHICVWLSPAEIKANLPEEFSEFPDTQVILDCTELRCQTPSSPLLQSEMYSNYKSHCTMKCLIGIAPHGAVTFVTQLYAGSMSDKEIFKQSGIAKHLTENMAVMVNKGFLISDCVKCKVKETQAIARLKVHVERAIRRIKQNKLFDSVITLSHTVNISQLFTVACLLSNYQNKALLKQLNQLIQQCDTLAVDGHDFKEDFEFPLSNGHTITDWKLILRFGLKLRLHPNEMRRNPQRLAAGSRSSTGRVSQLSIPRFVLWSWARCRFMGCEGNLDVTHESARARASGSWRRQQPPGATAPLRGSGKRSSGVQLGNAAGDRFWVGVCGAHRRHESACSVTAEERVKHGQLHALLVPPTPGDHCTLTVGGI
ncbi:hypothetical protein DNTS_026788, partial [Danionella cerebrum]